MQIAGGVTNVLVSVGVPAILGLQVWVVRKISTFDVKFTRLDTWAFGPNGQNGANGRLGHIEQKVEELRQAS